MAQNLELPTIHPTAYPKEKHSSAVVGTAWKVSPKKHFKYIVVLPTVFLAIACCSGLWFLLICLIPAINHAKKANDFRKNGNHIQAKRHSRISLFLTSLAINFFTIAVIIFVIAVGFAIKTIVSEIRDII